MSDQNTHTLSTGSGAESALHESGVNYRQYLHSVFGESTAEYFLNPSSLTKHTPAWYTKLKENMRDHISAEALWDALRKRSAQVLKELEDKPTQQAEELCIDWAGLMRQDHLLCQSQIRLMFRSAQWNQAYTALLLQHRPLSLLSDSDLTEELSQHLPEKNPQPTEFTTTESAQLSC